MKFKYVIGKNFQSLPDIEQRMELDFNDGVLLLIGNNSITGGSNGSGKSTWVELIRWTIYGSSRSNVNDVVSWYTNKNCKGNIVWEDLGHTYEIIRYRKHEKHKDKIYFFIDSVDKSFKNNEDTQRLIQDTIKINEKAFSSSIIFSPSTSKNFMSSTDVERLKIFENVLQLDEINKLAKITKKQLRAVVIKYEEIEKELSIKKASIKTNKESIESYKESIESKKIALEKQILTYKNKLKRFSEINVDEEKRKKKEIENLNNKIKDLKNKIDLQVIKIIVNTPASEIPVISDNIREEQEAIENFIKNPDSCPTCNSIVGKDALENHIKEHKDKLKKYEKQLDEKIRESSEIEKKNKILFEETNSLKKEKTILEDRVEKIEVVDDETLEEATSKIEHYNNEINSLQKQSGSLYDVVYIKKILSIIKKTKEECDALQKKYNNIGELKTYYEYFVDLFGNKSGLKKYIISKLLNIFNEKINEYLTSYFSYDIEIIFNQDLKSIINLKNENDVSFERFSSGEQMRMELSIVFAFFNIVKIYFGNTTNLLVLDEILDLNLDSIGINTTISILDKISKDNSVIVISHREEYKSVFNKVLLVNKKKNGSFLEELSL